MLRKRNTKIKNISTKKNRKKEKYMDTKNILSNIY